MNGGASTTLSDLDCNGIADTGDGGHDRRIKGWAEAFNICDRIGARLCTVLELVDEVYRPAKLLRWSVSSVCIDMLRVCYFQVTKNTGCQHDGEMVWSSQTHADCGDNQHVVAPGGRNVAYQICPEECPARHGCAEDGHAGDGLGNQAASRDPNTCQCKPKCANNGNSHAVRCCADAAPWAPAPQAAPYYCNAPPLAAVYPATGFTCPPGCSFKATGTPQYAGQPAPGICTPRMNNLVHGLPHGACHSDGCVADGTCSLTTPHFTGKNGIRRCGKTSQSTVGWGGEPGRAIDGKKCTSWGDGSCTHTDDGLLGDRNGPNGEGAMNDDGTPHGPAWWAVDLGGTADIDHVRLWHRTGCGAGADGRSETSGGLCNKRLEGARIYVTQEPLCPAPSGRCNYIWPVCSAGMTTNCYLGIIHASTTNPEFLNEPTCTVAPDHTNPAYQQSQGCPPGCVSNGAMCSTPPTATATPGVAPPRVCPHTDPNTCAPDPPPPPHITGVRGRHITVAHIPASMQQTNQQGGQMHAAGGTSSGAVITICEIAVYGYNVQNTASSIDAGDQKRTGSVTPYVGQLSTVQRPAIPTCISKYGCSQLKDMYGGWKLETSFNAAAAVCGESDNGLGGCGKDQCFGGIVSGGQVRQHRKETQPPFVLKQCLSGG